MPESPIPSSVVHKDFPTARVRIDRGLVITAQNGRLVELRNIHGEPPEIYPIRYTYVGLLKHTPFVVAHEQFWEGGGYVLVSLADGTAHHVLGRASASPGGARIVVWSQDIEAQYDPNELRIFKIDGSALVEEYRLEGVRNEALLDNWGPALVAWKSDVDLEFRKSGWTASGASLCSPMRVKFSEKLGWQPVEQPNQPLHPDALTRAGERRR
jgi:hypothetical protein